MSETFHHISHNGTDFTKRAFLGNGYFGIDISNNFGQGFGICEAIDPFPVTYLGGAFVDEKQVGRKSMESVIFRPLNMFSIVPANQSLEGNFETLEDLTQEIDLQSAKVTTQGIWGEYQIKTDIFLCRHRSNLGVFRMECTNFTNSDHKFIQLSSKDPRVKYKTLELTELEGVSVFNTSIKEDGKEFRGEGPLQVLQLSQLKVLTLNGDEIPFITEWKLPKEIGLDFEDDSRFENSISFEASEPFAIELYFGIFKDSDTSEDLLDYAVRIFQEGVIEGYDLLLKNHKLSWDNEIWSRRIIVEDPEIQKMINVAYYSLGCSLKQGIINSVSGGNGLNGNGWAGHIFWDADLWMNLGIVLWAPELSRCISQFRYQVLPGARQHRIDYVNEYDIEGVTEGAKFPWQSTTSGVERSPPGWTAQEHITCDVIFGQYLQYTATKDEDYLRNIAFPLVFEACTYLGQRVQKESDGFYHFRGVIPADEFPFPGLVDDNGFTNLYVAKCMQIAIDWATHLGKEYPSHWNEIVEKMFYNFDEENRRIVEFTGYHGQTIKQADTDLLTFPIEYPLPKDVKRNNMLYYFNRLPPDHIMMGAAIFSVIACELGMDDKIWEYFSDQFNHFHKDNFYNASESPKNHCWPFLTGLGGFLTSFYYGFGGIRLRDDGLLFSPILVDNLPEIVFNKICFQGIALKYRIQDHGDKFTLQSLEDTVPLTIYCREDKLYLPTMSEYPEIIKIEGKNEIKYTLELPLLEEIIFKLQEKKE